MSNTRELIDALVAGDAESIETSFNVAMADRISARMDDMRADIAKGMFSSESAVAEEESQELNVEDLTQEEVAALEQEIIAEELEEELQENLEEKYMGFEKAVKSLAAKGARDPKALAAWIGRKKYGKEKFQAAAAASKKLG